MRIRNLLWGYPPISSLCFGEVLAKTISSLLKTESYRQNPPTAKNKQTIKRTLIPLPTLQSINVVAMYNYSAHFILEDFLDRSSRSGTESLSSIAQNKINLSSDGFGSLRVVTWIQVRSGPYKVDGLTDR